MTIATTILVAGLLMFNEYLRFTQQKKEYKINYINDQKEYIKYVAQNELVSIEKQKKLLEERVYKELESFVEEASLMGENLYSYYHNKKADKEVKTIIMNSIANLRRKKNNTKILITALDGKGVCYPDHPEFEDKNLIGLKDVDNNLVVQNELDLLSKKDKGFLTYQHKTNLLPKNHPKYKIVFVKKFKHYNWYLSSYEYLDNHYDDFKTEILSRISKVRFINGGYIFLNQIDGKPLALDGEIYQGNFNFFDGSDPYRMAVFKKELDAARSSADGGYFYYYWNKIGDTVKVEKCSYAVEFPEWKWLLGAGFYLDEADREIQRNFMDYRQKFMQNFLQLLILLMVIIGLEILFVNRFNKKYFSDLNLFFKFFKKAAESSEQLKIEHFHFEEFRDTALAANSMIIAKEKIFKELIVERKKAQESDRLKSAFLANMSHEIRTPMNAILGFSELLAENKSDQKERDQNNELINSNGDKLLALINDIIDLSKIEANQLEIKVQIFNLYDFIELSYARNKTALEKLVKDHIDFILVNELPQTTNASTDPVRINQIIDNLLSNAFKFTDRGFISFHAELVADMLKIRITDSGIGIAKEDVVHIYERFRQVENEMHKEFAGTGLGLAITHNLVEMLKGTIQVESELGKGTSFTVLLPILFSQEP